MKIQMRARGILIRRLARECVGVETQIVLIRTVCIARGGLYKCGALVLLFNKCPVTGSSNQKVRVCL